MRNMRIVSSIIATTLMLSGCNVDKTQNSTPAAVETKTETESTSTVDIAEEPQPTDVPEPEKKIEFTGEYENTVTDDNGDIFFAYNSPIEDSIETKSQDGPGYAHIKYLSDGSIVCDISYGKKDVDNDREKKIQEYLDSVGEEEVIEMVDHDGVAEEETVKRPIIANKLDDISTDIGDFTYYRIFEGNSDGKIENKTFTEEAFLDTGDFVLHASKFSGDPKRLMSPYGDETLVEIIKVAFNDVAYKTKLVADNTYDPSLKLMSIVGLDDGGDEEAVVAEKDTPEETVIASSETKKDPDSSESSKSEKDDKSQKAQQQEAPAKAADLSGSFYYTCTDAEGVSWSITANSGKPVAGTTINWSGVYPGCYNAIAPLNANGSINYGAQKKGIMSFTLSGAYAQNGVIMWINAWESDGDGGMDAAVKWFPDGHYEG